MTAIFSIVRFILEARRNIDEDNSCLVVNSQFDYLSTWRSGYCYLNKGERNLNQSTDNSFVERVAKNNS